MQITRALIEQGRSDKGGWNAKQLKAIGVRWPPRQGWMNHVVGMEVSVEAAAQFLELRKGGWKPDAATEFDEKGAYLARPRGKVAHLWTGNDTACRMWSTGGIGYQDGYITIAEPGSRRVCANCLGSDRASQEGMRSPRMAAPDEPRPGKDQGVAVKDRRKARAGGIR